MLQSVVRWLLPREDHFYDFLERQADVASEASQALAEFREESCTVNSVRIKVQSLEHNGDKIVHEMEEALAKTFVTPLDREDLQRLSSELDTVLDLTNAAARACHLFGVSRPTEPMVRLMEKLVECTQLLKATLPKLRRHEYQEILEDTRTLRKLEKDADAVYRQAISELFQDPQIDAKKLLREMHVLEDLENAVDHCDHVGKTLTNLAVKHG
jgi:predicted phosphate transport protein (TIGR00153 family)